MSDSSSDPHAAGQAATHAAASETVPAGSDLPVDATLAVAQATAIRAGLPALEARMLLTHVTGLNRTQLITRDTQPLTAEQHAAFIGLLARRLRGEPMAYLIGEREFYGRVFRVTPAVLIPRPDTEIAVQAALARLPPASTGEPPRVLDLGTGSGILAVTLACERVDADVWATDISTDALDIARANAAALGARVHFLQSDWYRALPGETRFDLIVSNPPYIAAGDPHLSSGDLRFEPVDALTDHADGLTDLAAIVDGATRRLRAGGWLLMEHGYDQGEHARALLRDAGFADVFTDRDLGGNERCSGGRWTGPAR